MKIGSSSHPPSYPQSTLAWLSSLSLPSSVPFPTVLDLQKGEIILDLAAYVTGKPLPPGVKRRSATTKLTLGDSIFNLGLLMREFAPLLPPELRIKPVDLVENEPALYDIVKFFQDMSPSHPRTPTPTSKVPTLNLQLLGPAKKRIASTPVSKAAASTPGSKEASANRPAVPSPKKIISKTALNTPTKPIVAATRGSAASQKRQSAEKPPEKRYPDIPPYEKSALLAWIAGLHLAGKTANLADVETAAASGVLLCDLVNRLEGRKDPIKGIERFPRNKTAVGANVMKALSVLRGRPSMQARYLWTAQEIAMGEGNVIWGLLRDIRSSYHPQPSPACPSRPSTTHQPHSSDPFSTHPVTTRLSIDHLSPKSTTNSTHKVRSLSVETGQSLGGSVSQEAMDMMPIPREQDMIREVREWVDKLKLGHLMRHEGKHVLQDPFRNGILLCEVVHRTEGLESITIDRSPATISAARSNVETALSVLRQTRPELPNALLRLGEKITQGHARSIWTLLWSLAQVHSLDTRPPHPPVSLSTPYPPPFQKRLDHSLAVWIHSLGASSLQVCPERVSDLISSIRTGVLLCDLVGKILKIQINGVFFSPKLANSAISNVRKALEPLRLNLDMCQEYVWREKEISYGDLESIYGLLEDLHRFADKLPPRKPGIRSKTPYLGLILPGEQPPAPPPEGNKPNRHRSSLSASISSDFQGENPNIAHFLSQFRAKNPADKASAGRSSLQGRSDLTPTPIPPAKVVFKTFDSTLARSTWDNIDEHWLEEWLDQLGVRFQIPFVINSLRNGVVLCQVIERLARTAIAGFTEYPKTTAAALNNVRKALEILRKRPHFPKEYLFVEEEVLRGDERVIIGLFGAVRSSFRTWEKKPVNRYGSEKSFLTTLLG